MTARRDRVCTKGPREKRNRSRNGLDMLAIRGLHGTIRNRAASERAAAERRAAAEVVEGPGFRARLHGAHGHGPLPGRAGLGPRCARALRPDHAGSCCFRPALRAGGLRRVQGVSAGGWANRDVPPGRQCAPLQRLGAAPVDARASSGALHPALGCAHRPRARMVPSVPGQSLYIRPLMIATEAALGVRPAKEYLFLLFGSPAGAYFPQGVKPLSVWLSKEYVRAAPGGTGEAKCAGNYAASLIAQQQAMDRDCQQVIWLDARERRFVEEMGGMNVFFVYRDGGRVRLVTPSLTGSLL